MAPKKIDFLDCESCASFASRRISRHLTQLYDKHMRQTGLKNTQFTLLTVLIRIGCPYPVSKVSEFMGLERTTLTRNLQPLLEKEYIQFEDSEDRRVRLVGITKEGISAAKAAYPFWKKAQESVSEHTMKLLKELSETLEQ